MKITSVLAISFTIVFLSACSSGSSNPGSPVAGNDQTNPSTAPTNPSSGPNTNTGSNPNSTNAIAGLWNFSSNEPPDNRVDVSYVLFANGLLTNYNYLGDTVDMGENCYEISATDFNACM